MRRRFSLAWASVLVTLLIAGPASAQDSQKGAPPAAEDVESLRAEIRKLQDQIRILQEQMATLAARGAATGAVTTPAGGTAGSTGAGTQGAPPEVATVPPPYTPPPPNVLPPAGTAPPARSQSLLNPAISAVFQSIGTTSLKHGGDDNGFSLSEAEIALQSVVDPYTRMDLFLTFPADGTAEVEEGYVTTLNLPGPLQLKGGRFKSAFGKWNTLHNHAFFTVDRPDALVSFFGDESLATDGLSLSILIPNRWDLYIDSLTEVGTTLGDPSFNSRRRDLTWLQHLSAFLPTGPNSTIEAGLSAAFGKTGASDTLLQAIADASLALDPRERLASSTQGIDLTYKWKPLTLNVYKSFLWQSEWLRSRRDVDRLVGTTLVPDTVSSQGGYSYVEWQLAKRWRVGGRYDFAQLPEDSAARQDAVSAVVRFQPSEFQEIRFQVKRANRNDRAVQEFGGERNDTRLYFEWIPVIGAHGAHKY